MKPKRLCFHYRTLLLIVTAWSLGTWASFHTLSNIALSQDSVPHSVKASFQYDRVQINALSFRVRSDLEFELVADSNIVRWPIVATWDADGNLLIAESAGVKQSVQDQLISKPHRVIRLMDQDRDGKFDSQVVVADDFAFPEGLMVYGKHLLVSAPPEIWKLTDDDGDGLYEQRDVWHDGKTLTHCANDLHGPFLGPEGWVYWSKSAFANQSFPMRQNYVQESSASHLYRKPFDSKIADRVLTGGMDNLVHVAFDQDGDRFFVSTFLHHPGNGLRDGIGHGVYGSVFGKSHAVLDGHPRTGPLMLPMVELGPAAPAGLIVKSPSDEPSREEPNRLIAAQFNLQRVSEHTLTRTGTSYVSSNSDLVIGDQLDFHPVCVLEDIDGSLLVVDTGGWYDLCCPSSGNEERIATGGIYRLRAKNQSIGSGKSKYDLVAQWREIDRLIESSPAKALAHTNARIRSHAEMALLPPGKELDAGLRNELAKCLNDESLSTDARKGAFWALAKSLASQPLQLSKAGRQPGNSFDRTPEFVNAILHGTAPDLLPAALQLTSTYAWPDQVDRLITLLDHDDFTIKRLAAECLGRIGDPKGTSVILELWAKVYEQALQDRTLEHSLLFALIELNTHDASKETSLSILEDRIGNWRVDPVQAIAAIQVLKETKSITEKSHDPLILAFESNNEHLASVAQDTILSHDSLVTKYVAYLRSQDNLAIPAARAASLLKRAYRNPAVVSWISDTVLDNSELDDSDSNVLRASIVLDQLEAYRNQELPLSWQTGLAKVMNRQDQRADQVLKAIGATKVPSEARALIDAISKRIASENFAVSAAAIASIPRGLIAISVTQQTDVIKVLLESGHKERPLAWQSLKRLDLDSAPWTLLLSEITQFGPVELPSVVEALATSHVLSDPSLGIRLVEVLDTLPATKTLPQEQLEKWFQSSNAETRELLQSKMRKWFAPPADMNAKIDELLAKLESGDAYRGQDVFRNEKAACIACHRIGYVGGAIGPELTRIGQSRNRRDFIEAIAFPSHRIAQGYQTTSVLTDDDEVYSGLVVAEDESRIELVLSAAKRVSIDKSSILKRSQGTTSIMPAGIETVLTARELSDLIAFLEQSR
ncbi:MAG: hypothetical protein MUC43_06610 [Pirellula sp.]|nr:hypothetical protein [Pirellula sp.]